MAVSGLPAVSVSCDEYQDTSDLRGTEGDEPGIRVVAAARQFGEFTQPVALQPVQRRLRTAVAQRLATADHDAITPASHQRSANVAIQVHALPRFEWGRRTQQLRGVGATADPQQTSVGLE